VPRQAREDRWDALHQHRDVAKGEEVMQHPDRSQGEEEMHSAFDPATLAGDLDDVGRLYAELFAGLHDEVWDKPAQRGSKEWTLHETIAHQCALNGAGLQSIRHTLRGEHYTFIGLDSRYRFDAYNRRGIDEHLGIPRSELCAEFLGILDQAASIASGLRPEQAELTAQLPIYNRPVRIDEALSIIIFHAGLVHTAQVAEPAGLPPLWTQLAPEFRYRVITRTMLPFSLLYRRDIGGALRATIAFRVGGAGGGEWYVHVSPDSSVFGEGAVKHPSLAIHLRDTAVFCQMLTGRFHLATGLISRKMKLRGDLRLFLRMNRLFSVDARPRGADQEPLHVERA
jgi:SCP-2 sterol transfer family protein